MASNISVESGKELHCQLIAALMGKIFVDWSGYNTLLVLLRGHGFSDRDIAECRKSEATLFEHLELKGLIEEGKYDILLKVLKGLNEPAIQLIKSYHVKFEAMSHKEDAGQKRRHENDEPVPSCSKVQKTEQVNKATSTTSLRVRSKAEDRTLKRMQEQRESKTFVPTQAVTKGQSLLKENKIAIFSGLAGDGKTENALFIMNQSWLENPDAIYIKIDSLSEWQHVDPNVESVVLLDDCLGKTNGDTNAINNTEKWKDIYSCIKHGKIRLIMTVRQHIYIKYCTKLENAGIELFMKRNVIDMTNEEFCLSEEIKREMLLKHCQSRNIEIVDGFERTNDKGLKLSEFTVDKIVQSNSVIGFPYTCFLFCCHSKYTIQGAKFFEKPLEILKKDIDDLANSKTKDERIQYCLMSYMLLNGGRINLKNMNHELFDNVVKSLGINSPTERERKEAIELLNHRFIVGEYPWFSFKHQTINECVALSFKDDNISLLLQTCSLAFISEFLRPANYKKVEGEECIILQADDYRYIVKRISESLRIVDEVHIIIRWWIRHPLMDDCGFVDLFMEVLKSNESCRELKKCVPLYFVLRFDKNFLIDRLYNAMNKDISKQDINRWLHLTVGSNKIDTAMWCLEKSRVVEADLNNLLMSVKSSEMMIKIIHHEKLRGYPFYQGVLTNHFYILLNVIRTCWNYKVVHAMLHQWPKIDRELVLKLLFALIICNDEKSIDVILTKRPDVSGQQDIENILTVSCLAGCNKTLELILNNRAYPLSRNTVQKMFVSTYTTGRKEMLNSFLDFKLKEISEDIRNLHVLAYLGEFEVFMKLINIGMNIKSKSETDKSLLMYTIKGYKRVFEFRRISKKVRWMVKYSKDCNLSDIIYFIEHIIQEMDGDATTSDAILQGTSDYRISYYLMQTDNAKEDDIIPQGTSDYRMIFNYLMQTDNANLTDLNMILDKHGSTVVHYCVLFNDIQTLTLIEHTYRNVLSSKTCDGVSCLHVAALFGNYDVFKLLAEAGLSIKERDAFSRSVLQYAMVAYVSAFNCDWEGINSCKHIRSYYLSLKKFYKRPEKDDLKQLLGFMIQNEDVCLTDLDMVMDTQGSTITHYFVFLNNIQTLDVIANRYKSVLSSKTLEGVTCLHVAALSGRNYVFKLLVKAGLSLKENDAFSRSVLQYAMIGYVSAFNCDWEGINSCKHIRSYYLSLKKFDKRPEKDDLKQLLGFLIQNEDVCLTDLDMEIDTHGSTIAHVCMVFNDVQTVNILVKRYDSVLLSKTFDGVTCLHVAALYGSYDLFLLLVKTGLNIKDRDKFGISVLQYAIIGYCSVLDLDLEKLFHKNYGSAFLLKYIERHRHIHEQEGYKKILELLIQNEDVCLTDLNMVIDPHGTTIVHCCVVLNDVQILDSLAKKYINILYSKTYQNMTCFHVAAFFGRVRIIETLVQTGLEITEINDLGRNLLQCVLVGYISCLYLKYVYDENNTETEDIDTNVDTSVNCANDEFSGINTRNNDHNMTSLKVQEHGKRNGRFWLKYILTSFRVREKFGNVSDYSQILLLLVNHGISTDLDIILDKHGCTLAHYCVVQDDQATIDLLRKVCPSVLSRENFNKVKPIDLAVFLGKYKTFQKLYCSQQNTEELNKILLKGKQYKQYCAYATNEGKFLNFLQSTYISWGDENDYDAIERAINKYVV